MLCAQEARALQRVSDVSPYAVEAFAPLPHEARSASNYGLFIGINEFDGRSGLNNLRFAVNDAIALAYVLSIDLLLIPPANIWLGLSGEPDEEPHLSKWKDLKAAGAHVFDATKLDVLDAISDLLEAASERDALIISSFSSHGFEDGSAAYIMPRDGRNAFIRDTGVSLTTIRDQLQRAAANKRILIVDACREVVDAGTRGTRTLQEGFVHALQQSEGMALLLSCGPDEFSFEYERLRQGVFTHFLLEGLRGHAPADPNTGFITLGAVFDYAADNTQRWANQYGRGRVQQPRQNVDPNAKRIPLAISPQMLRRIEQALDGWDAGLNHQILGLLNSAQARNPGVITPAVRHEVEATFFALRDARNRVAMDALVQDVTTLLGVGNPRYDQLFLSAWNAFKQEFGSATPQTQQRTARDRVDAPVQQDFVAVRPATPVNPALEAWQQQRSVLEQHIAAGRWPEAWGLTALLVADPIAVQDVRLQGQIQLLREQILVAVQQRLREDLQAREAHGDWERIAELWEQRNEDEILRNVVWEDAESQRWSTRLALWRQIPVRLRAIDEWLGQGDPAAALQAWPEIEGMHRTLRMEPSAATLARIEQARLYDNLLQRWQGMADALAALQAQNRHAEAVRLLDGFEHEVPDTFSPLKQSIVRAQADVRATWVNTLRQELAQALQNRDAAEVETMLTHRLRLAESAGARLDEAVEEQAHAFLADRAAFESAWQQVRALAQSDQYALALRDGASPKAAASRLLNPLELQRIESDWQIWNERAARVETARVAQAALEAAVVGADWPAAQMHLSELAALHGHAPYAVSARALQTLQASTANAIWQHWRHALKQAEQDADFNGWIKLADAAIVTMTASEIASLHEHTQFVRHHQSVLKTAMANHGQAITLHEMGDALAAITALDAAITGLSATTIAIPTAWQQQRSAWDAQLRTQLAEAEAMQLAQQRWEQLAKQHSEQLRTAIAQRNFAHARNHWQNWESENWSDKSSAAALLYSNAREEWIPRLQSLATSQVRTRAVEVLGSFDAQGMLALVQEAELWAGEGWIRREVPELADVQKQAQSYPLAEESLLSLRAAAVSDDPAAIQIALSRAQRPELSYWRDMPSFGAALSDADAQLQLLTDRAAVAGRLAAQLTEHWQGDDMRSLQRLLRRIDEQNIAVPGETRAHYAHLLQRQQAALRHEGSAQQAQQTHQWQSASDHWQQAATIWQAIGRIEHSERAASAAFAATRQAEQQTAALALLASVDEFVAAGRFADAIIAIHPTPAYFARFPDLQERLLNTRNHAQARLADASLKQLQQDWQSADAQLISNSLIQQRAWITDGVLPASYARHLLDYEQRLQTLRRAQQLLAVIEAPQSLAGLGRARQQASEARSLFAGLQRPDAVARIDAITASWVQLAERSVGSVEQQTLSNLLERADARLQEQLAGNRLLTRQGAQAWNQWLRSVFEAHRTAFQNDAQLQQQFTALQRSIRSHTATTRVVW